MSQNMFCYQCQETAGCTGCTNSGVCGKTPEVAAMQDLLVYVTRGISAVTTHLRSLGTEISAEINHLITVNLFTTITNANFDKEMIVARIRETLDTKENLLKQCPDTSVLPAAALWNGEEHTFAVKAALVGVLSTKDEDIRSLREMITYGLKGLSAYSKHANALLKENAELDAFLQRALAATLDDSLTVSDYVNLTLETGKYGVEGMALLDAANTGAYGHPEMTRVNIGVGKRPGILVSGHDLHDLKRLLEQTKGKGINIYTHGEMLPCHGYEGLKKYPHLVGNFGGAWQDQQKQFDNLPGCILMTTNCLMRPRESYKDRIYSTNVVGWEGVKYIGKKENGEKDFSEIIAQALELGGYPEDEEAHEILVGFGHHATLGYADKIVEAVKSGKLRHFFLIGGCDGARPGRNYYTEFAKKVPQDCIILTLACGKYRFNKLEFGEVASLPRLLDVGQCNDAYSAIRIATALADAFGTDVNGLPLSPQYHQDSTSQM